MNVFNNTCNSVSFAAHYEGVLGIDPEKVFEVGMSAYNMYRDPIPTASRMLFSSLRLVRGTTQNLTWRIVNGIRVAGNSLKIVNTLSPFEGGYKDPASRVIAMTNMGESLFCLYNGANSFQQGVEASTRRQKLFHFGMSLFALGMACANLYSVHKLLQNPA